MMNMDCEYDPYVNEQNTMYKDSSLHEEDNKKNFPDVAIDERLSNAYVLLTDCMILNLKSSQKVKLDALNSDEGRQHLADIATDERLFNSFILLTDCTVPNAKPSKKVQHAKKTCDQNLRRSRILYKSNSSLQNLSTDRSMQSFDDTESVGPTKQAREGHTSDDAECYEKPDTRLPFCLYCKKHRKQFAIHLSIHRKENYVKKYFKAKKDKKKQNRILSFIRNKGYGLLEQLYEEIMPVKSRREGVEVKKVQCDMCMGRFSKPTLPKHIKNCYGNDLKKKN